MPNADDAQVSTADIRSVARVGQICALFGPDAPELTAAEVAESTGLNRTTAYRYCTSMASAGILDKGSRRGTFSLGRLMLELGVLALGRDGVVDLARPHLERLRTATRSTAVLSIRGTQGAVVALVEEDTSRSVVVTVRPGTKLDRNAAQSLLMEAFGDPLTDTDPPDSSPADRARHQQEVYEARKNGHSVAWQESTYAVAAPVFGSRGLVATVALLGAGELDLALLLEPLTSTAAALTAELGGEAD